MSCCGPCLNFVLCALVITETGKDNCHRDTSCQCSKLCLQLQPTLNPVTTTNTCLRLRHPSTVAEFSRTVCPVRLVDPPKRKPVKSDELEWRTPPSAIDYRARPSERNSQIGDLCAPLNNSKQVLHFEHEKTTEKQLRNTLPRPRTQPELCRSGLNPGDRYVNRIGLVGYLNTRSRSR